MVVSNESGDIQVNIMDREEGEHNDSNNDDDFVDNDNVDNNSNNDNDDNDDNDDEPVGRDEKKVSALQELVDTIDDGSGDIQVNIMDREEGEHDDNNNNDYDFVDNDDNVDNNSNNDNDDNDDELVGRDEKNVSALQELVDTIDVGDNVDDDVVDLGKSTVNEHQQPPSCIETSCTIICCPCTMLMHCYVCCAK
jgi:hypothetical protein